jgi:aspartate/methionine/tyrosine aminotransferase
LLSVGPDIRFRVEAFAVAYSFFLAKLLAKSGIARWLPSVRRLTDGGGEFVHYYGDRVLAAPLGSLRDLAGLHESAGPDVIDLATASPGFDLTPSGSTKLPADRRGLPPIGGMPELREVVTEKRRTDLGVDLPDDEVLITPGVAGGLSIALDTFLNPRDRVVLLDPSSPLHALMLRQRRARIRWVPTWNEHGRARFHGAALVEALRGARLIVLASPGNPTGGVLAADDLEAIAWWAARHDVLIFSDDAYERFHYDRSLPRIAALPKARKRTLVAGSVSKGHGLAAARVGWLAGHRHLIRACGVTAVCQAMAVPTLCQQLALAALRQGSESFWPIHNEFEARRRYGHERLTALELMPDWPAGGMFFWVPVGHFGLTGRAFAEALLRSKKVAVWPGDHFGPSGVGRVRLSYSADDGRFRQGLIRFAEFVRELQGRQAAALRLAAA